MKDKRPGHTRNCPTDKGIAIVEVNIRESKTKDVILVAVTVVIIIEGSSV
jgi:hypothetical protein